jgi:hypothetical protein
MMIPGGQEGLFIRKDTVEGDTYIKSASTKRERLF